MATIAEKWTQQVKWDVVKNSLKEGLPINTIVRITGLPAEEINRMKEEMTKSKSSAPNGPRL
jgi:hypothetical protein